MGGCGSFIGIDSPEEEAEDEPEDILEDIVTDEHIVDEEMAESVSEPAE